MTRTEWRIMYRAQRILRSWKGTSLGLLCGSDPVPSALRMALAAEKP